MKKLVTTLLTTSATTLGLLVAGTVSANADATYTVKAGDCVWSISQDYKTTIENIEHANNIKGHLILPGQELTIPGVDEKPVYTPVQTAPVSAAQSAAPVAAEPVQTSTAPVVTEQATAPVQEEPEQPAVTTPAEPVQPSQSVEAPATPSYTGDNMQAYVLGQMESRTGVSASTWNHIINRESNWQPHVVNSTSGAYGLFQNMHISGGSVQEQIDAAVNLYNVQGMQAWAL